MATDLSAGLLERLAQVRELCPEIRFGQLLATVGLLAEDETGHSLWEVEGTVFAAARERFAADLALGGKTRPNEPREDRFRDLDRGERQWFTW